MTGVGEADPGAFACAVETCKAKYGISFDAVRQYQWEGMRFLLNSGHALLADEMGLGKTPQALLAAQLLKASGRADRILVVAPTSVCLNWELETRRWTPMLRARRLQGGLEDRRAQLTLPFNLWIASYEQIQRDIDFVRSRPRYDLVVLDEAQRIKNRSARLAISCCRIPRERSWALTGTPIENRADDMRSIFEFAQSGLLDGATSGREIRDRIRPYFLRRTKQEVLPELPPIIAQTIWLDMGPNQRDSYTEVWGEARSGYRKGQGSMSNASIFGRISALKQICNFDPRTGESSKLEALREILDEVDAQGTKILVFSQYVETLREIQRRLPYSKVHMFHGGLSQVARESVVRDFEEKCGPQIMLCSLRAAGVGINLNSAETVILFDRWWNPALESQAVSRAHRFGKQGSLHVVRFAVRRSVEERVERILERKKLLFQEFVEELADNSPHKPSRGELLEILGMGDGPGLDQAAIREERWKRV